MRIFLNHHRSQRPRIGIFGISLFALFLSPYSAGTETDAPHCKYASLATLPIQNVRNQLIVHGSINGKATDMLLDTGAQITTVTNLGVEKLGLPMFHSQLTTIGVGGESRTYETTVDEMALDRFKTSHRSRFLVAMNSSVTYNVIVAADMLFNADIEFNLADHYVKLLEPTNCDDAVLAYWDKNASEAPLSEISSIDHRQVVTVEINGQKIRALIDSGAQYSILNLAAAARLGITPESPGVKKVGLGGGFGAHMTEVWISQFDNFAIGDELVKNPTLRIMDLWGAAQSDMVNFSRDISSGGDPEMLLGADFLSAHRVLLALSQRRIYFTYNGGALFPKEVDAPYH